MFNSGEILETINMVRKEHLDVRTLTMGISLLDCVRGTTEETVDRIKFKIGDYAKDLVKTASDLQCEFGIPIVNKRISVTPVSLLGGGRLDYVKLARAIDEIGRELGVDFVGGYTALVHKGMTDFERKFIATIPEVLSTTSNLCSSVNIGSTKSGINMEAVAMMGRVVKECAKLTADRGSIACVKLVVFCNVGVALYGECEVAGGAFIVVEVVFCQSAVEVWFAHARTDAYYHVEVSYGEYVVFEVECVAAYNHQAFGVELSFCTERYDDGCEKKYCSPVLHLVVLFVLYVQCALPRSRFIRRFLFI